MRFIRIISTLISLLALIWACKSNPSPRMSDALKKEQKALLEIAKIPSLSQFRAALTQELSRGSANQVKVLNSEGFVIEIRLVGNPSSSSTSIPFDSFLKPLKELKHLKKIIATGLHLKGHLPADLFRFEALEKLDLSQNEITGKIPVEVAQLTHLKLLNLSHNKVSGDIPPELLQKNKSITLDLTHTQIKKPSAGSTSSTQHIFVHSSENEEPSNPTPSGTTTPTPTISETDETQAEITPEEISATLLHELQNFSAEIPFLIKHDDQSRVTPFGPYFTTNTDILVPLSNTDGSITIEWKVPTHADGISGALNNAWDRKNFSPSNNQLIKFDFSFAVWWKETNDSHSESYTVSLPYTLKKEGRTYEGKVTAVIPYRERTSPDYATFYQNDDTLGAFSFDGLALSYSDGSEVTEEHRFFDPETGDPIGEKILKYEFGKTISLPQQHNNRNLSWYIGAVHVLRHASRVHLVNNNELQVDDPDQGIGLIYLCAQTSIGSSSKERAQKNRCFRLFAPKATAP